MVPLTSKTHDPTDIKACIHNLTLVGTQVKTHLATPFPCGYGITSRKMPGMSDSTCITE